LMVGSIMMMTYSSSVEVVSSRYKVGMLMVPVEAL
jgi:hypothetical protein